MRFVILASLFSKLAEAVQSSSNLVTKEPLPRLLPPGTYRSVVSAHSGSSTSLPDLEMVIEDLEEGQAVRFLAKHGKWEHIMRKAAPVTQFRKAGKTPSGSKCYFFDNPTHDISTFAHDLIWKITRKEGWDHVHRKLNVCKRKEGVFIGLLPERKDGKIKGWKYRVNMTRAEGPPGDIQDLVSGPPRVIEPIHISKRTAPKRKLSSSPSPDEDAPKRKAIKRPTGDAAGGPQVGPVSNGFYQTPAYSPDKIRLTVDTDHRPALRVCDFNFEPCAGAITIVNGVKMRYNEEGTCLKPVFLRFKTDSGVTNRLEVRIFGRDLVLDERSTLLCADGDGGLTLLMSRSDNQEETPMNVSLLRVH
ncbi:hypothetical protein FOZ63_001232 [Perkinsus olseni]|uniref:Uncharacterized protein n=1 Tax=Perkinsus olseni TaxID=32597 RepID=A0A7J6UBZ8_PEROL|nr:hypothetical protein FOZ63_001232 [Perkinsus olseni]